MYGCMSSCNGCLLAEVVVQISPGTDGRNSVLLSLESFSPQDPLVEVALQALLLAL